MRPFWTEDYVACVLYVVYDTSSAPAYALAAFAYPRDAEWYVENMQKVNPKRSFEVKEE
jgi:hypothetical protein